jgi:hypothetical protein
VAAGKAASAECQDAVDKKGLNLFFSSMRKIVDVAALTVPLFESVYAQVTHE